MKLTEELQKKIIIEEIKNAWDRNRVGNYLNNREKPQWFIDTNPYPEHHFLEYIANDAADNIIKKFYKNKEITITKEQILSLGWKEWGEIDGKSFYKKDIFLRTYIGYINNKVESFIISIYNEEGIKFKGNCLSIENLKFICKLLNI